MRFNNLLGDRQAEPGVLAEILVRAVGVKALENLVERSGPNAWTVVVDNDLDLVLDPSAGHPHDPAGGENERALSIRLLMT